MDNRELAPVGSETSEKQQAAGNKAPRRRTLCIAATVLCFRLRLRWAWAWAWG
jgi:hypothetical protein